MSNPNSEEEIDSSSIPKSEELRAQRRFSDPSHSTSSSPKTEKWRCSVCDYVNSESIAQCALCETNSDYPSTATAEIGESAEAIASSMPSSSLIASLRETADSVSERLLTLAKTDEETTGFLDDLGEPSAALHPFLASITSAGIIFADDNSTTPIPAPDDASLEEIFRGTLFSKSEEKQEVIPQSPPHLARIGFEALPPSPQRQSCPQSMEEPWEMPPDLTATETPTKHFVKDDDNESVESTSPAQRLLRLLVCCVVGLVLFLSIWLVQDRDQDNGRGAPGIRVTPSPTVTTAPATTQPTLRPTSSPSPSTFSPTTIVPEQPTTVDFVPETTFQGTIEGARLGTGVAMDRSGSFLASLGGGGNIKFYEVSSAGWTFVSTVFSPDDVNHMDMIVVDGTPILAMASRLSVQVLQYLNGNWISLGTLEWTAEDITAPTVALSSSGKGLAMASLENGGDNWHVQVWEWTDSWIHKGDAVVYYTTTNPFLALSLDLSGDATVFAIGDWSIANPAVMVQTYKWDGQEWIPKGSMSNFIWGPSDVALTDDGNCFAVATPTPGTARVYHWNEALQDWDILGTDLIGGSSIDLSENGRRVMVGSPLTSTVVVYDLSSDEQWEASTLLSGEIGDQYGASIVMAGDGNTLAVGSPLNDEGGRNAGKLLVYT